MNIVEFTVKLVVRLNFHRNRTYSLTRHLLPSILSDAIMYHKMRSIASPNSVLQGPVGIFVVHIGHGVAMPARELLIAIRSLVEGFNMKKESDSTWDNYKRYLDNLYAAFELLIMAGWPGVTKNSAISWPQDRSVVKGQMVAFNAVRLGAISSEFMGENASLQNSIGIMSLNPHLQFSFTFILGLIKLVWEFVHVEVEGVTFPEDVMRRKFWLKLSVSRNERMRRWYKTLTHLPSWFRDADLKKYLRELENSGASVSSFVNSIRLNFLSLKLLLLSVQSIRFLMAFLIDSKN